MMEMPEVKFGDNGQVLAAFFCGDDCSGLEIDQLDVIGRASARIEVTRSGTDSSVVLVCEDQKWATFDPRLYEMRFPGVNETSGFRGNGKRYLIGGFGTDMGYLGYWMRQSRGGPSRFRFRDSGLEVSKVAPHAIVHARRLDSRMRLTITAIGGDIPLEVYGIGRKPIELYVMGK